LANKLLYIALQKKIIRCKKEMAHINKRTIFLKDKGGNVAATAAIIEISGNITIKINFNSLYGGKNKMFFAAEGDVLPFMLYEITAAKTITTAAEGGLGENISALLFIYDNKSASFAAYGSLGNGILPQTLLNKALQSMAGDKIIAPVSSGNIEILQDTATVQADETVKTIENYGGDSVIAESLTENSAPQIQKYSEKTELLQQKKDEKVIQTVTNLLKNIDITQVSDEIILEKKEKEKEKEKENEIQIKHKSDSQSEKMTEQSKENISEENLQQFYQDTYNILADDKYIAEDTTLGDIDIIAEDNYFEIADGSLSGDEAAIKEDTNKDFISEGLHYGLGSFYNFYDSFNQNDIPVIKEKDIKNKGENMDYYLKVKTKADKLFSENPIDEFLTGIIPESKFVRIYYNKEKYYCFGVVSESGIVQYICYGVPSFYSENPPQEFKGLSRWIPADASDAKGKGYYMIFQSAESGKYIQT
ncbi:MAG: hypothetical protein PHE12_03895, partial [Clostridia bacterium]|nr:hypothetical protein [Clostridia bacterium]